MSRTMSMAPCGGGASSNAMAFPVSGCRNATPADHSAMGVSASAASPYRRSPTSGIPRDANCTRIWCVRPVSSRTRTSAHPARRSSTRYRSRASRTSFSRPLGHIGHPPRLVPAQQVRQLSPRPPSAFPAPPPDTFSRIPPPVSAVTAPQRRRRSVRTPSALLPARPAGVPSVCTRCAASAAAARAFRPADPPTLPPPALPPPRSAYPHTRYP